MQREYIGVLVSFFHQSLQVTWFAFVFNQSSCLGVICRTTGAGLRDHLTSSGLGPPGWVTGILWLNQGPQTPQHQTRGLGLKHCAQVEM